MQLIDYIGSQRITAWYAVYTLKNLASLWGQGKEVDCWKMVLYELNFQPIHLIFMTYQFWHTYFGTIKKTSHFKASLHFRHALYNTGIVLIVFVSLGAFI